MNKSNANGSVPLTSVKSLSAALLFVVAAAAQTQNGNPGKVNFSRLANPSLDPYTNSPTTVQQQWLQTNFARMGVFTTYFDTRTSWYSNAQVYQDLYAIYNPSSLATQHPDWILHDASGNSLYIPWGCANGTCPQFAADISNPNFRAWWIGQMQGTLSRGNYKGLWIDDVNMNFSVSDGWGNPVTVLDATTGAPMTWTAWRTYVAQFLTQIRQAFPNKEILHNSVWCAGPSGVRDLDPAIQAQIAAADIINIERGIGSDPGLTGGTGDFSLNVLFGYIDRVHAAGRNVVLEQYDVTDVATRQYSVAGYFLISSGNDYYGDTVTTPDNWWSGFNVDLGSPLGPRTYANGVYRRNFSQGMVLLGEPGSATQTVTLPASFKTLDGTAVNSVTVSAYQGVILLGAYPGASAPALSFTTSSLPNATVGASYAAGLAASGGSGTFTFSASGLPSGLAVGGSGISGIPGAGTAGTYSNVLVTAIDANTKATAQKTLSLTVYAPLAITTSSLSSATIGAPYNAKLAATGGSGNYSWSAANLPPGFAISGSTLAGTPSGSSSTTSVIFTITDANTTLSAQKTLSMTVFAAPAIAVSALPSGTTGALYSAPLAGTGGSGNFTWAASGLPSGVVLTGSSLGGTPAAAGTFSAVALTMTDAATGVTAQKTFSITVSAPPASTSGPAPTPAPTPTPTGPTIETSALPAGALHGVYTAQLTVSGGSGNFAWTASGLPPGIALNGNRLGGTPTATGKYSQVAITVLDLSTGLQAQKVLSILITNAPTVGRNGSRPHGFRQLRAADTGN
ncbi:MAG: putative glycoside hydrolase family 15 protein [Acidobacteriota bacterium]|nr:putative glycoside hydrolase family 15 protein [Acidobacteriota bacterium]